MINLLHTFFFYKLGLHDLSCIFFANNSGFEINSIILENY